MSTRNNSGPDHLTQAELDEANREFRRLEAEAGEHRNRLDNAFFESSKNPENIKYDEELAALQEPTFSRASATS